MNQSGHGYREWRNSEHICALVDEYDDRHLGHIVKIDQWHAYDATHFDEASRGVTYLGAFTKVEDAKLRVEYAVAQRSRPRALGAGMGSHAGLM